MTDVKIVMIPFDTKDMTIPAEFSLGESLSDMLIKSAVQGLLKTYTDRPVRAAYVLDLDEKVSPVNFTVDGKPHRLTHHGLVYTRDNEGYEIIAGVGERLPCDAERFFVRLYM